MNAAYVVVDSPVDELTLVTDGLALTGLHLAVHRHADRTGWGRRTEPEQAPPVLRRAARQLQDYFAGERTTFDLPLGAVGTEFQHRVWRALAEIPYARTWSYADLAARVGSPGASRAVGLANGRNPISIVVPCHRVVGSDGSLTGYGGGVARKQALLQLEQRVGGASLW